MMRIGWALPRHVRALGREGDDSCRTITPVPAESPPPENRLLYARFCDQTFAFSELAPGLPSPANCFALLPRSPLGWLFVGFPALQFTEKAFALELLFQDPQCLIDIIVTNENFQSGFLSRLNKQVGYGYSGAARSLAVAQRGRILSECPIHGPPLAVAQARGF